MTDVTNLVINVNSDGLSDVLDDLDDLIDRGSHATRASSAFTKALVRVGGAATLASAGIGSIVKASSAEAKEFAKFARIANESVSDFKALSFATETVGISAEKLSDISKDVQDRIGDFIATGGGEFADFFENIAPKVGLTAQALQGLSGPDALVAMKNALDNANVSAEEQVFYMEALANDASLLIPLLADGGKELNNQANRARSLGVAVESIDFDKLIEAEGAFKDFSAAFGGLFTRVSAQLAPAVQTVTEKLSEFISHLSGVFDAGLISQSIDTILSKFDIFASETSTIVDFLSKTWESFFGTSEVKGLMGAGKSTVDFLIQAFKNLPENMKAVVQLMAVEFGSLVDHGKVIGQAFGDVIGIELAKLVEKSKAHGKAIAQALNPFDDNEFDLEARLAELDKMASDSVKSRLDEANRRIDNTRNLRRESILSIMDERNASVESFNIQIANLVELNKKIAENSKQRKSLTDEFDKPEIVEAGVETVTKKTQDSSDKDLQDLINDLRTEEEEILASYNRRLQIILKNTEEGSRAQADLKSRLDAQFVTDVSDDFRTDDTSIDQTDLEIMKIQGSFDRKRAIILENTELTEKQRTELTLSMTESRDKQIEELENQRLMNSKIILSEELSATGAVFDSMTGLAKSFAGEQSGIYKGMFAVSKSFSLAQSAISIATGIANAAALPFPANLGAMATVISTTAGLISSIRGTSFDGASSASSKSFAGAFDNGGFISAGKIGLVGEFGPELVQGPANVRSRRETAEIFRNGGQSNDTKAPTPVTTVTKVINILDPSLVTDALASEEGEEILMNFITNHPELIQSVANA